MWKAQDKAVRQAILTKKPVKCGRVKWTVEGDFLYCELPSGRRLAYHKAHISGGDIVYMTTSSTTKKYVKNKTYGGKVVENCLTGDTLVVTIDGVKPLIAVTKEDKVWDGENWVNTDGVIKRGIKNTGELAGIRLTAEHKILAGNSWKRAIDMDEKSWQDALKSGQSLENYGYLKVGVETTAKPFVAVIAETQWLSIRDSCLEDLLGVGTVGIKARATKDGSIQASCLKNSSLYGRTGIREWCQDAITKSVKPILTTAAEVLKCIPLGWKIVKCFLNMQKNLPDGTTPNLIWIESKITEGMPLETLGFAPEKKIAAIVETLRPLLSKEKRSCLSISGKSIALFGKAITRFITICLKEKVQKKLWNTTGRQEEVYDLLNCGSNNRFTIISKDGPVIVHNCIQAIARDLLAYAMLKAEKAGYKIVLTVHDELVAEVPEGWGSTEEFNKTITTTPIWAKGCPVNAEGWRGKRYKK